MQLQLFIIQPIESPVHEEVAVHREYNKSHCWQYDIRLQNLDRDIAESGLSIDDIASLTVNDFLFTAIESETGRAQAIEFIKRHEWLGTISQMPTHWFGAYYITKDVIPRYALAGVIIMNIPNAFSKMLGDDTQERLISRGACISWSPKNLASALLMYAIRFMVNHTPYRLFTAYADPAARELGTIYQACNFYYLGNTFGADARYINPYTGRVVSSRFFRQLSAFKRYAKELGIDWQPTWSGKTLPADIRATLLSYGRKKILTAKKIFLPAKHKYAYVLGRTPTETKRLRARFLQNVQIYPYPKNRGQ